MGDIGDGALCLRDNGDGAARLSGGRSVPSFVPHTPVRLRPESQFAKGLQHSIDFIDSLIDLLAGLFDL